MLCGTDIGVMLQGKPLLQAAHITAHPREISVIIGPNGSGKTTLLRALMGEIAHSGQVLLNGADIRQQKKTGNLQPCALFCRNQPRWRFPLRLWKWFALG